METQDIASHKHKRRRKSRKLKREQQDSELPEDVRTEEVPAPGSLKRKLEEEEPEGGGEEPTITKFKHLKGKICKELRQALRERDFKHLTEIQQLAIPPLLEGLDVVGTAKTGSGKTLAFLVPAIQRLVEQGPEWGTGVVVVSPTRELAQQTYQVALSLTTHLPHLSVGVVTGGESREQESSMLADCPSLLVATPGRLEDHILHTWSFKYDTVCCLILDEADKILNQGFEKQIKTILNRFPRERQTMLFSATMTIRTKELVELALKPDHHWVSAGTDDPTLTVAGLEQKYVQVPASIRLTIFTVVMFHSTEGKTIVFFNSIKSVEFHFAIFTHPKFREEFYSRLGDLSFIMIHGKMPQNERRAALQRFASSQNAVLFCTDVAARGLDIPEVDFVFQYEPPANLDDYIHRVGRTARGLGGTGRALVALQPHELGFVQYLQESAIPVTQKKHKFKDSSIENFVKKELVDQDPELQSLAKEAYQAYFKTYNLINLKEHFEICFLDKSEVAMSFGLSSPPSLDIEISMRKAKQRRKLYHRKLHVGS